MSKQPITLYTGKLIDVEWDERLCIHVGECGYAKGDLFVAGRDPWCEPDLTSLDEIADVIGRCPSGALVYRVKDGTVEEAADAQNTVQVSYNGPYFIRGDLTIEGTHDKNMPGTQYRAALCRCGHSKNKPFCDNSHEAVNFKDYAAIGESGATLENKGGSLVITAIKDGPLMLKGNVTLLAGSGRRAWQGTKVALCRCGASKNKPFCDGSHIGAGFKSE